MSNTMKRVFSLVLAVAMIASMALVLGSCKPEEPQKPVYADKYADYTDYDERSQKIYEDVLGEFLAVYTEAKAEQNVSKRFALMAIAEAKLLESGVMLPLGTNGGNYAISRVAPYTATTALWGNDSYRYHNVVITTEPIKSPDRDALKAMWAEMTDGAAYESAVREYLTEKGYEFQYDYALGYNSDPQTWDVLATSMAADSEAIVNTYDGLLEYDLKNNLKPALATGYSYNWDQEGWTEEDGYKVTFTLRQGAKWVNIQGQEVGEVKADDFVAGMQHMLDAEGGLEYLVQGVIVNADEYIKGEVTDFDEVGVTAVDDYTVVYTLCGKVSYFDTMVGYGVFAPMNRAFYTLNGGKFGAEYNPEAEDYLYGTKPEYIAYCGPYTVASNTAESEITFAKNASYWNAENVTVNNIVWKFNDGKVVTKAYEDMKANTVAGCGLTANTLENARSEKVGETGKTWFELYSYVSGTDATSFMAFVNLDRQAYANFNDATKAVSTTTEAERSLTKRAMLNKNFRLALSFAVDRAAYNALVVGEELKLNSLRNAYTPGTFVKLAEEVTVKINGTDTTFPAGTYYGAIVQAQLDADEVPVKAWDPTMDGGIGSADGFDGWYSAENAKAYLDKAIAELAAEGVVVDANNPIIIDLPTYTGSEVYINRSNAYKQSVEAATNGLVKVNLVSCETAAEWYYAGYYPPTGAEGNYDVCDVSGWGPDYGDPSTYLDTMLPDYAGYMTKAIGIF